MLPMLELGKGGFVTGGYLALQIRHRSIGPILTFREYILRDIVPHFRNLNERADQIGSEYYERAALSPPMRTLTVTCQGSLKTHTITR